MKTKTGLCFLIAGLALAAPVLGQSVRQIKPRKVNPPKIVENLPIIPQYMFKAETRLTPEQQLMALAPPPDTDFWFCEISHVRITRISYQFDCRQWFQNGEGRLARFVIRRDGTAPSWALSPDDFETLQHALSDKRYGWSLVAQGKEHFVRVFFTLVGKKVPGKYCSHSPLDFTASNTDCHDLMSFDFKPQKES